MIHDFVDLIGIDSVVEDPDYEGAVRLQRAPAALIPALNALAQKRILQPASNEIRFVAGPGGVEITLSAADGEGTASVLFGDMLSGQVHAIGSEPTVLRIAATPRLASLPEAIRREFAFAPAVIRLKLAGAPIRFHGIEGEGVRPPTADELPAKRLLTYGTSITHGASATAPHLAYSSLLARHLGMDHINLGLGGACHCEPELADFIAERSDWHAATLALSVNMVPFFTLEQFSERVRHLIDRVAGSNTERPVFAITLYPHFRDFGFADNNGIGSDKSAAFRRALREAVTDCPHPNVHLIEGDEVLTTAANLTPDLIHPSDYGMIEMAANLARVLRSRLD